MGKGNKLINLHKADLTDGSDGLVALMPVKKGESLVVMAGTKKLTLKGDELAYYNGDCAQRGNKLPKGYQSPKVSILCRVDASSTLR